MRVREIDYSAEQPLSDVFMGYIGEHNETVIRAIPTTEMLENESVATFVLAFGVGGKVYHSEAVTKADVIEAGYMEQALFNDVTAEDEIEIQLEAYAYDNSLLAKTEIAYGYFEPSVDGDDAMITGDDGIIATIAKNTAARHTHTNKAVLDAITSPYPTEHVVEYDDSVFIAGQQLSLGTEFIVSGDVTAEGEALHNARITNIELLVNDEWISIYTLIQATVSAREAALPGIFTTPIVDDDVTIVGAVNIDVTDTYYPSAIRIYYINISEAQND